MNDISVERLTTTEIERHDYMIDLDPTDPLDPFPEIKIALSCAGGERVYQANHHGPSMCWLHELKRLHDQRAYNVLNVCSDKWKLFGPSKYSMSTWSDKLHQHFNIEWIDIHKLENPKTHKTLDSSNSNGGHYYGIKLGIELAHLLLPSQKHTKSIVFNNPLITFVLMDLQFSVKGPPATILCVQFLSSVIPLVEDDIGRINSFFDRSGSTSMALLAAACVMWEKVTTVDAQQYIVESINCINIMETCLSTHANSFKGLIIENHKNGLLQLYLPQYSHELIHNIVVVAEFIGIKMSMQYNVSCIGISGFAFVSNYNKYNKCTNHIQISMDEYVHIISNWIANIVQIVISHYNTPQIPIPLDDNNIAIESASSMNDEISKTLIHWQCRFRRWYNKQYCQDSMEQIYHENDKSRTKVIMMAKN